ncbi:MAG: ABC transporter ATP-binding protein [Dehalococcoidia bacterium]|nr:ABC transporter ATP-binding protein [Dehalococcoidia bacterium]
MSARTAAPPTTDVAASVQDVSFSYTTPGGEERLALDGLTLEIPAGAVFGLLGPNGSGKSTLLSLLAGLRQPSDGADRSADPRPEVRVLGQPPSTALRARIGLLFQETSLDPLMTPGETLWLHGRLYGLGGRALHERIGALLESVGLAERARSPVSTLSGGMKRRLELARVLLPSPELILLDEPTTGLDPDAEAALWARLLEANRGGATVVLATNKVNEAEKHCDRVAFIHRGRLAAEGSPAELKAGLKRDAVWVEWPGFTPALAEEIGAWEGVGRLTWAQPTLHATVDAASAFVPRLFQAAGDGIRAVRIRESTLEDAYFDIVGASLAEGEPAR